MDDFEIHPYSEYYFSNELTKEEVRILKSGTNSFRESLFEKGKIPKSIKGIGILKYKGTIIRKTGDSDGINEKLKILLLILKLHISHDFFNPSMSYIDIKAFSIFSIGIEDGWTNKFGYVRNIENLYSTVPEGINGLKHINFYPIEYCINQVPISLRIFKGGESVYNVNVDYDDFTHIYHGIIKNKALYKKISNIASLNYGLEQQNDLFFYYAIIPSIIEVILFPLKKYKKQSAVKYGEYLDSIIIKDNDYILCKMFEEQKERGIIARTIFEIYDLRNLLLHEGVKSLNKLKIMFKGYEVRLYDIFQLILKYSILFELIKNGIIKNEFIIIETEGDVYYHNKIRIYGRQSILYMDYELLNLIEKIKSDYEIKNKAQ